MMRMVFWARFTGTCDVTPDVSDPLSDPLTQVAVPDENVAVTPVVASAPGINEASNICDCPDRSFNVEFEKSMLEIGPLVEAARAGEAERYEFEAT